jgi:hypothetical protein
VIAKPGYETAIASWFSDRCEKQSRLKAIKENRIGMAGGGFFHPDAEVAETIKRWLAQDISELTGLIDRYTI